MAINFHVTGDKALKAALERLEKKVAKQSVRKAVNKTARKALKAAKAAVPVDTGTLKKSLAVKSKTLRNGTILAFVGPRRGFKVDKKTKVRTMTKFARVKQLSSGRVIVMNPTKYSHLVEFGTIKTRAKAFIWPAVRAVQADLLPAIAAEVNAAARNP